MSEENKQEQTLNAVLQRLQAIGAKQIKEDTHLDIKKIEDILEKRFERLDYIRAKGFINILEKEYKVNLSAWLEEYHLSRPQEEQEVHEEERPKTTPIVLKNPKILLYLGGIVGGIIILGVCAILLWNTNQNKSQTHQQDIRQEVQVQQEQEALKLPQNTSQTQGGAEDENKPIEQKIQNPQPSQPSTSASLVKPQTKQVEDKQETLVHSQPQVVVEDRDPSEYGESVFENIAFNPQNILLLESKTKLWVGYINLDTKKRNANTQTEFEIPLDGTVLINVARGRFTLKIDNEDMYFSGYKPVYFIYTQQGGLKKISKEEFMHLNGGREW